ncbi:MAG: multiheme c-type cytochrome [Planctomycetota bacterium]
MTRRASILSSLLLASLTTGVALSWPNQDEDAPEDKPGFALAVVCSSCHSASEASVAMRDRQGRSVAPYDLWQSTMMANSTRDPFWRAMVAAEVQTNPSRRAEIEAKCLRCHAPMTSEIAENHGVVAKMSHLADLETDLGLAAQEGVSCTICHQIQPDGLGTEASYDGGFHIDASRKIFGPHEEPFTMPMSRMSSFTPTHGEHILESSLCGSCHTLLTSPLDGDGNVEPIDFIEQAAYLEWRNSAFSTEGEKPGERAQSCQGCHLPTRDIDGVPIRTRLAHNPMGTDFGAIEERKPFGRHLLVGGNTLVPELFKRFAEELNVAAPVDAFEATLEATRQQLAHRTASLTIGESEQDGDDLVIPITVTNLTGHKLPTGYPSRRLFLQVRVLDEAGEAVFETGTFDAQGRLTTAGDVHPAERAGGPIHPHADALRSSDQVAVWESVMADTEGRPTYRLLRAASYAKDDRLLPIGWSSEHAEAERTSPHGVSGDDDFEPGRDTVRIVVPSSAEPKRIEATLYYQVLSPRFAAELFAIDAPEVRTFERMLNVLEAWPTEKVAEASRALR